MYTCSYVVYAKRADTMRAHKSTVQKYVPYTIRDIFIFLEGGGEGGLETFIY